MSTTISIPANGVAVKQLVGSYTYCYFRTATQPFQVSYDGGSTWNTRYQNDQDKPARVNKYIYFKALDGNASDVTFDVGDSQFTAQQAQVTGSVTSAMANNIADNIPVVPLQFQAVHNAGAAAKLANAVLYFRWAYFIAQKDLAGTPNTGDVHIGFSAAAQPITLSLGDQHVLPIPVGAKIDFQNVWIKADNNGDGVSVLYV